MLAQVRFLMIRRRHDWLTGDKPRRFFSGECLDVGTDIRKCIARGISKMVAPVAQAPPCRIG